MEVKRSTSPFYSVFRLIYPILTIKPIHNYFYPFIFILIMIEIVRPQAPVLRQLTTYGRDHNRYIVSGDDMYPIWSPFGDKIAFYATRNMNNDIYVIDADGRNETRLTIIESAETHPSWSPDGQKIAYVSTKVGTRKTSYSQIWIMDADGKNKVKIYSYEYGSTPNGSTQDWTLGAPKWSPNGRYIAFTAFTGTTVYNVNYDIWVIGTDGSNPVNLTNRNGRDELPVWSPDGSKIAFVRLERDGHDIWSVGVDGRNMTQLTTYEGRDYCPSWSPDGTKIAYYSSRSGNLDIWIMDADGRNKVQLTSSQESAEFFPIWSPDGGKIAFLSRINGGPDIYMIDIGGENQTKLTNNETINWGPQAGLFQDEPMSWAPDGQRIAFVSSRNESKDIWVIELQGIVQPYIPMTITSPWASRPPADELRKRILNTAVVEFQERGSLEIEDAGAILAEWMSSSLHKTEVFNLYERILLNKVLQEQELGLTGILDDQTVSEIGKVFGVEAIVTGTISKFGNTYSIVAKLINTQTAEVIATGDIRSMGLDALASMMDQLAWQLALE